MLTLEQRLKILEERISRLEGNDPPWLWLMRSHLGLSEVPGKEHNPWIVQAHALLGHENATDEMAWCSSCLAQCMMEAGQSIEAPTPQGRVTTMARSWLLWGRPIPEPRVGCVVVFSRKGMPGSGHVGLFLAKREGKVEVIGGNQQNKICISDYPESTVLGYRWPL